LVLGSSDKQLVHSSPDRQLVYGSYFNSIDILIKAQSVNSEEAHTDRITSVNKVVHQLRSRIICMVVASLHTFTPSPNSYAKLLFTNLKGRDDLIDGRVRAMCCDLEDSHLQLLDQTCALVHQ
jgi:hypothetical protein